MVTLDSRKNEHCAVEKNKAKTISKLLENSLKTNYYYCFCSTQLFAREWTEAEATFYTRVHIA